jgi:general L-amino acid transport system permease protein
MSEKLSYKLSEHHDMPPLRKTVGSMRWMRRNLFSSPVNTLLTLISLWIIYISVPPVIQWALLDADWMGTSRDDCTREGACWVYIGFWFKQIMYGRYPETEVWRINVSYILLVGALIPLFISGFKHKGLLTLFLLVVYPIISYFLLIGDSFGLPLVETSLWGGLFLTLVISLVGIVASLPIGIFLALGRRSNMPVVRALSIGFIEIWRGVPLITVLFMSSVMFPLFLPEGMNFDKLIRALVGVMLFSAAYMAEVVRGGLQAVPKGQIEAAEALGMSYWNTMSLIVMPQALKMVIPGIVNSFIALFKDTTLVLTIGLFDLLGTIQIIGTNADWLGFHIEGYVFTAFIFWIFCFSMSRYSMHLEKKLNTGH